MTINNLKTNLQMKPSIPIEKYFIARFHVTIKINYEHMKRILFTILTGVGILSTAVAQETVYPAPAQTQIIALTNATIHVGNGQVIENGMIVISGGKITEVKPSAAITDVKVIDCKGKHIYPGLILAN